MKTYPKQSPNFAYDPARYTLPETTGEFNATEEFLRRRIFEYLVDKDETYVFDIWVEVFGNNPNTKPPPQGFHAGRQNPAFPELEAYRKHCQKRQVRTTIQTSQRRLQRRYLP